MYVIKRVDQERGYVTMPGSPYSYTQYLANARVYTDRSKAEKDRCPDNEIVVSVREILKGNICDNPM